MIEFVLGLLLQGAQNANNMGLIAGEFVVAIAVGLWGYQLYSNIEQPSDTWDDFLKTLSVCMMVFAVVDVLVLVIRMM